MWIKRTLSVLVVLLASRQAAVQGQSVFNTNATIMDINTDGGGYVTEAEVLAFYKSHWVSPASRCDFTETILNLYTEDSLLASVLFDELKSNSGMTLSEEEFQTALLMGESQVTTASARSTLQMHVDRAIEVASTPYLYTDGYIEVDIFDPLTWARDIDGDGNEELVWSEVSAGITRTLDLNRDYFIYRCEFVDAMNQYSQHPASAANMYDVLFSERDRTWADVDSQFLLALVTTDRGNTATTEEFAAYFSTKNFEVSGLQILPDGTLDLTGGVSRLHDNRLWLMAIVGLISWPLL